MKYGLKVGHPNLRFNSSVIVSLLFIELQSSFGLSEFKHFLGSDPMTFFKKVF